MRRYPRAASLGVERRLAIGLPGALDSEDRNQGEAERSDPDEAHDHRRKPEQHREPNGHEASQKRESDGHPEADADDYQVVEPVRKLLRHAMRRVRLTPGRGASRHHAAVVLIATIGVLGIGVAQICAETVVARRQLRDMFSERGWQLLTAQRRLTLPNRAKFRVTVSREGERREGTAMVGSWWISPLWQSDPEVEFDLSEP